MRELFGNNSLSSRAHAFARGIWRRTRPLYAGWQGKSDPCYRM